MEAANQEFLDLTLKFDKESKRISVDIFARAYNNFICVLPSTCFPKTNTEYIPKAVALPFQEEYVILMVNLRDLVQNTKAI